MALSEPPSSASNIQSSLAAPTGTRAPRDRQPPVPPLRRNPRRSVNEGPSVFRLLAICATFLALAQVAWAGLRGQPLFGGLIAIPVAMGAAFPFIRKVARGEDAFDLFGVLYLGLALRFVGSYYRFQGAADATDYYEVGSNLADSFRRFHFAVDTGRNIPGTGSVRYFSGLVLAIIGKHMFVEFIVFTFISFLGVLLLYRAFTTAFPTGDRKRYALLLLLWPSMVFWPSSVGKESLMLFGLGLAAYGTARLFTHRRGGIIGLAGGLTVLVLIRPHLAMVVIVAVCAAYLFVRSTRGSRVLSGTKILALVVIIGGGAFIATQTAQFLNLENLGSGGVTSALTATSDQTDQGGSQFTPIRADQSPFLYPGSVATVLFRPLPIEAHNMVMLLTAIEGSLLVILTATSWRRLVALPRAIPREPYVAFATTLVLVFCFVFSVISNFGILVRQRTQMLPFYFVILAVPPAAGAARKAVAAKRRTTVLDRSA